MLMAVSRGEGMAELQPEPSVPRPRLAPDTSSLSSFPHHLSPGAGQWWGWDGKGSKS